MSSVMRYIAQRKTRKFVVTQDENQGEYGAYYFTQDQVDQWLADNSTDLYTTGGIVIVTGTFADVMDNLNTSGRFSARKTLTDLGVEYVIGNTVNSQIITLRLVQGQADVVSGGLDGTVGYIVVENNCTNTPDVSGRWTPRVARI